MHCKETQDFGENKNGSYAAGGLKGHTGYDESCGFGSTILSYKNGLVYKVVDDKRPANDGSGFWAVFMLVEENGEWSEWSYGHCSEIFVQEGQRILAGDPIAREGNRGEVYAGGVRITLAMQAAGDKRGSHRHVQKRLLERIKDDSNPRGRFITEWSPSVAGAYKDSEGYLYRIKNWDNGYNGCVPPFIKNKLTYLQIALDLSNKLLRLMTGK